MSLTWAQGMQKIVLAAYKLGADLNPVTDSDIWRLSMCLHTAAERALDI